MQPLIYLDYAATTPVDLRVAEQMARCLTQEGYFGNPSSSHVFGRKALEQIAQAREQVANLIHAEPSEIIWTSGATEANNLALKGAAQLYKSKGKHIITVKTEHRAVLDCCQQLEKDGFAVTYLSPEKTGLLAIEKLAEAIRPDTILISVMQVNNETGVIQDIQAIADMASARGILFHMDAAQSAGKLPLNVKNTPVDLISFSAHKIYGPKGVGALYVRKKPRVRVAAQMHGGGHEQGMRSGTLATHQIVGMGTAFAIANEEMKADQDRIAQLKERFWKGIQHLPVCNLSGDYAIPNILNIAFAFIQSNELIQALPTVAISAGSACLAKGIEPSYVLRAMGLSMEEAACGVRLSFGRFTTTAEIDLVIQAIQAVASQRGFQ